MSCLGVLFAITQEEADRFLAVASDEEARELVHEIEDAWETESLVEVGKAWDSIHRTLSDGSLAIDGGTFPLNRLILGGKHLYKGDDYIITYVSADEVPSVANGLMGVTEEWFTERFARLRDSDFPQEYLCTKEAYENLLGYSWSYFECARNLYEWAAKNGRGVIFTVDQ